MFAFRAQLFIDGMLLITLLARASRTCVAAAFSMHYYLYDSHESIAML
jgi:hypothetical protein